MQLNNLQVQEGESSGGSELAGSSHDAQMVVALRKMKKELEVMVVHTVQQVIRPVVEDLMSKVVKVESDLEKFLTGRNRNYVDEIDTSRERVLQLKFLDEVSFNVLTGKAIKAKGGTPIRVALLDETTGHVVYDRPEASGTVEILVLEASPDNNECSWSLEEFNNRIIRDNDKKKPHFSKSQYVYLKEGISILSDVKLGHDSSWTKPCLCMLGARIVGNFHGVKVKEAWTRSFMVKDSRTDLYKKRYPPFLLDELWKLKNIGKDGPPCQRLNKARILTVQDFLFLHHINAQLLKEIAGVHGQKWNATVNHAQTCVIDDKKIYLYCPSSSESSETKVGVVFDVVGRMKGIIRNSHYVSINNLSEAEKICYTTFIACQHNLLLSAFQNREDITPFEDENSLLHQFPYPSTGNADTNDSRLGTDPCDFDLTIVKSTTNVDDPTEPKSIDSFFRQSDMGEPYELVSEDPNQVPSSLFYYLEPYLEKFGDNENFMALIFGDSNRPSETLGPEPHSCQQSKAGSNYWVRTLAVMLWVLRARKRVTDQGDSHASKKQKIG